ncbi:D-alanyl-D-alanine carboxypeptidase [Salipaludibacillus agaradhaerens]|uniref:D-alanyl-D-alanine carboxypeptidase family protein n=1 Tax=Salipaludibacillus agaradhaerens TaxID=76935 RepID=UPI00216CA207|nr:D-alanyl-D-alanine carboxypeptidase [Salipaludibacillus agaradhaerens]MCR6118534.1 D-alanyl-D-alanine carboxypeptidase [Salipaludibacillus agaradhaerens]UJW57629.1 D-alanyl-D-alanine carboxypeptidase [Bacillus sp. A116_S68]
MKKLVTGCLSVLFFLTHIGFTSAEETTLEFAEEATSAILMERDTGTVLFDKNSHERLPPASMTKIMTMLLIMEAIDEGRLNWEDKVRTSERAASMGGSQIFLEPGEEMTVKEMMKGIAIVSGNDASVAMAEHLAGSEKEFVRLMNDRAKELGLTNTLFANSNGLPADNHYSSAYDLAIMGKALLQHEKITEFTSIYEDYLREDTSDPFWLVNTNKLIKFYPGVDGLKTGYTEEAKYCLTASANKDGMRMISVVMGAPATKDRNRYITEMFDYAYSQFELHNRYQPEDILAEAKIDKGASRSVQLVPATPVSLLIKKGQSLDGLTEKVTVSDHVRAPVKKGDQLGIITLHQDGKEVLSQPLVAKEDIKEASIWQLMKRAKDALSGRAS